MKLNGIEVKPRRKDKPKAVVPAVARCRWESARQGGSDAVRHNSQRSAIDRAVQLHGCVRVVTQEPDGIVHHGQWRRV
jgi:hypothetical protein